MTNDRINILALCALCLALSANAGQTFDKVALLLRDEPENIKCFTERLRDLTCFWEEEDGRNSSHDQYTFTYIYQYQNENSSSVCALSELPMRGGNGKKLFVCKLPRIEFFVSLYLCVFHKGRELYKRSLFIDQVLLLDQPANVTVVSTGKQGELNVTWPPPALKYIDDSLIYEVRYVMTGSPMRKEIVKASTKITLRGLQPGSKYKVFVRVKPDGVTYNGSWSAWSDPVFGTTTPSEVRGWTLKDGTAPLTRREEPNAANGTWTWVEALGLASNVNAEKDWYLVHGVPLPVPNIDPLIVVLLLIISLILILLSLAVLLYHHKFILSKLWPEIPSPEHKFPGLFTIYKGDFQEWLGHSNANRWPVHVYTEELPSPLEVLSEVSLAPLLTGHISPPKLPTTPRAAPFLREGPQALEEVEDHLEPQKMDASFIDRWQEPIHTHWMVEQLKAFQEHPEALSQLSLLECQDTYVTLNQNSQHAEREMQRGESLEESLPLQVLFESKGNSLSASSHSDIGSLQQSSRSGRLSSESSFEYPKHMWPNKVPGYTYMAVADSGVSMDYSPMSSSRIPDLGNGTIYGNDYKNDVLGHRHLFSGQQIHSGL